MWTLVPQNMIVDLGEKPEVERGLSLEAGAHPHGHRVWCEAAHSLGPPSTHFFLSHHIFHLLETRNQRLAIDEDELQKEWILFQCEQKAGSDREEGSNQRPSSTFPTAVSKHGAIKRENVCEGT